MVHLRNGVSFRIPPPPIYCSGFHCAHFSIARGMCSNKITLFRLGFLRVAQHGGEGGECPRPITSKTINDNEMKLGGVIKDH